MKHQIIAYTTGVSFIIFLNSAMAQVTDHTMTDMDMNHDMKIMEFHNVAPVFQKQLEKVFGAGLKMSDDFADNDFVKVNSSAQYVKKQLGKVDVMTLSMEEHKAWLKYQKTMYSGLKEITSTTNIEDQKRNFALFNVGLYQSIKAFGIRNEVYRQYCPMANGDKGAFWLSNIENIENPYFGDDMLKCGETRETLDF